MKMSKVFSQGQVEHTPLAAGVTERFDVPLSMKGIVITPGFLLKLNVGQMKAIEHAVNHHDALVEALRELLSVPFVSYAKHHNAMLEPRARAKELLNRISSEVE